MQRPDVQAVLAKLKDFQRDSCDYVFRRLCVDQNQTRRFLLADEVGLGKTLVTRGVIARIIDRLWDQVPRIDVIYICSNADIARQNINKLNLSHSDGPNGALASRITLLPITLSNLKNNKVNFVALTPGTSFDLKSSLGTRRERALLYWLLKEPWSLSGAGPLNVLQGNAGVDSFRELVRHFCSEETIDAALQEEFAKALDRRVVSEGIAGGPDIRSRFSDLVRRFAYARQHIPPKDREDQRNLIGELRHLLAVTCLRALEPDLVVLDEFQRFKHLLDGRDPNSELARGLFEYEGARVLLLSATPYKMYTLADESSDDNHYEDFIRTLRFLESDSARSGRLEELFKAYRREVLRLKDEDFERLRLLKAEIEAELRKVMSRTERLAVTEDRDGMLTQVAARDVQLDPNDLDVYLSLQEVARMLECGDIVELWKSAPYLLNFMEDYELKAAFKAAIDEPERRQKVADLIATRPLGLLPWNDIRQYERVDPANARLRALVTETLGAGAWQLLWLPPSLPYYQLGVPFASEAVARMTKRLVFSSWRVVPRVISTLLSYEAERQMLRSSETTPENTPEARARRTALLRFTRSDGRLTGMPVLGLLYPSTTLARDVDPLALALGLSQNGLPSIDVLLARAQERIGELLAKLRVAPTASSSQEDESWYWAAPVLLDLHADEPATRAWLDSPDLAGRWSGSESPDVDELGSLWAEHVNELRALVLSGGKGLGTQPRDLTLVLAQMSVAGPATTALRALARTCGDPGAFNTPALRHAAGQVAWSMRNLFNLPEVMAMLRGLAPTEPYWRRVLEYCVAGGLQSVLDEYAHVLRDTLGLVAQIPNHVAESIAEVMRHALSVRTVTLAADDIQVDPGTLAIRMAPQRLRARFAQRLEGDQSEEGKAEIRREQVREAFNSPFWPFVLATTSVGQEGLDFHPYCHAVVHWNLPSNPVDLEQREGRVHRYKGHAVRRNLARRYGSELNGLGTGDPWAKLFALAVQDRPPGTSDLVPFWVYAIEGGAKIERHVPAIPLSRDVAKLSALRRSLAAYRMIFGQPRQDDLITYLLAHFSPEEVRRLTDELRIDLTPPDGRTRRDNIAVLHIRASRTTHRERG